MYDVVDLGARVEAQAFVPICQSWHASRGQPQRSVRDDLNSSILPGAGFVLATVVAINAQGTIVALGLVDAGHGHGHGNHDVPTRIVLLVPRR